MLPEITLEETGVRGTLRVVGPDGSILGHVIESTVHPGQWRFALDSDLQIRLTSREIAAQCVSAAASVLLHPTPAHVRETPAIKLPAPKPFAPIKFEVNRPTIDELVNYLHRSGKPTRAILGEEVITEAVHILNRKRWVLEVRTPHECDVITAVLRHYSNGGGHFQGTLRRYLVKLEDA